MKGYAQYPSLTDKVVFITGGATGIGACLVEQFHRQGAQVVFTDIREEDGKALCQKLGSECQQLGGEHQPQFFPIDITQTQTLQQCIQDTAKRLGRLDVLINNASNDVRHDPLEVAVETWRNCMAVNLDAVFFACQAVLPMMQQQGSGAIINMSSINVLIGPDNMPGYVAAKSGINGITKALANQYGGDNIRVNSILPGWVATERQLSLWLTPDTEARWQERVAIKGRLQAMDVASMALFLAADDSAMITGQQFVVDAGRT